MDPISTAIENYARGIHPGMAALMSYIASRRQLLERATTVIARLECGTLTQADAQRLCGWSDEPAPETLRASCPVTIPPPEPTVPGTDIEETA
jgi:hypothetical protein